MNNKSRLKSAMAIAAVGITTANAATLAINFKGDAYGNEFGRDVTQTAFGVAAGDWNSDPGHTAGANDGGAGALTLSSVSFSWTFSNDWAQANAYAGTTGEDEVSFGQLDDGGSGADITVTGLSAWLAANSATSYTVSVIMSTGQGSPLDFVDTPVLDVPAGTTLGTIHVDNSGTPGSGPGTQGIDSITNLTSDTLFVDGQARAGNARGSIAGIIITSTPVPEPSSTALLGLGALGFILRRKR